mgnify:CR=1 FL=1
MPGEALYSGVLDALLHPLPSPSVPSSVTRASRKTWTPRYVGIVVVPIALTLLAWAAYMSGEGLWGLFRTHGFMALTMVAGSFVAGVSSEGGGAVAYPAMTLVFEIEPAVARNFSLAIQSVGMTAAALYIWARRVPVETTYLWLVAIGSVPGLVGGTYVVAPYVPPAYAKMMFVSFFLSYGLALFVINHVRSQDAVDALPTLTPGQQVELIGIGVIGGTLSAIFGNGVDICSFAFVTLKYRLSEKVATPTSVTLMAFTAVLGFALHALVIGDMQPEAYRFWWVSIPVVVFGAPLGAYVVSRVPRLYIAGLFYIVIAVQFATALWVIQPALPLLLFSAAVFAIGLFLFFQLPRWGPVPTPS